MTQRSGWISGHNIATVVLAGSLLTYFLIFVGRPIWALLAVGGGVLVSSALGRMGDTSAVVGTALYTAVTVSMTASFAVFAITVVVAAVVYYAWTKVKGTGLATAV